MQTNIQKDTERDTNIDKVKQTKRDNGHAGRENKFELILIQSNAFNRSNDKDHSNRAHLRLIYHLL